MANSDYDITFAGSVENLKEAVSQLGISASSFAAALAQAMKTMIGLGGYPEGLADSYAILGGNGNSEIGHYSHVEGTQTQTNGKYSWTTGYNNYGIAIDDRDRNTIFAINTDAPEKPVKLIREDDNPFYIDPEVIKLGGWLDSDID